NRDRSSQLVAKQATSRRRDLEVDPLTVRTDLEFLVVLGTEAIGLQENFGDIAIPQLVAAPAGLGIFKNVYGTIAAMKADIQVFGSPQEPDFCAALRIGILSLPVGIEGDGDGTRPVLRRRHLVRIECAWQAKGDGFGGEHE